MTTSNQQSVAEYPSSDLKERLQAKKPKSEEYSEGVYTEHVFSSSTLPSSTIQPLIFIGKIIVYIFYYYYFKEKFFYFQFINSKDILLI